ncbi:MAG: hypothetical protein HYY48_02590 [Gammaproteobacteria bacterium]|nr:hypothetical protein [Gammaproteobacteria bacterium]
MPLAGTFFAGWDVGSLLVLYWMENIVIGLSGVCKLLVFDFHHAGAEAMAYSVLGVPFYLAHYGLFCYGHGLLLQKFYLNVALSSYLAQGGLWALVLALAVVHVVSFRVDFLDREIRHLSRDDIAFGPYKRLIVLHVSLLLAAAAVTLVPWERSAMIILIAIKLGFDTYAWRRGHSIPA